MRRRDRWNRRRLQPARPAPYLAGLVLGLLTFKPQFCILVPMALIAAAVVLDAGVHDLAISELSRPCCFP